MTIYRQSIEKTKKNNITAKSIFGSYSASVLYMSFLCVFLLYLLHILWLCSLAHIVVVFGVKCANVFFDDIKIDISCAHWGKKTKSCLEFPSLVNRKITESHTHANNLIQIHRSKCTAKQWILYSDIPIDGRDRKTNNPTKTIRISYRLKKKRIEPISKREKKKTIDRIKYIKAIQKRKIK